MTSLLLPAEIRRYLATSVIARRIYYYPKVDSTNRIGVELARAGECDGTLVVTDNQTQGRGRLGRTWSSPAGTDLLFSLVLRPSGEPRSLLSLTLAFSVAVSVALSKT